jgi:hypothetical protein
MQFDWGCLSGVHTGWAVIEADNVAEAVLVVPPLLRSQAQVVKVSKFDAATLARVQVDELAPQSLEVIRMNTAFPCWGYLVVSRIAVVRRNDVRTIVRPVENFFSR